jgi:hypothetical protein
MDTYEVTRLWDAQLLFDVFEVSDDEGLVCTTILVFSGGYTWRQRGSVLSESE